MKESTRTDMAIRALIVILGVVASQVESQDVIGRNSLLCITFDRLDWKGDFIASKGIYLNNFGVQIQKDCGLDADCGLFEAPSHFEIPFFNNNAILQYSYSAWFKRSAEWDGALPTLYSKGACGKAVMEINIVDDTHLMVTTFTGFGIYNETYETESQSGDWRHIVVTVDVNYRNFQGWTFVYIDGQEVGHTNLDVSGGTPTIAGPLVIGANACEDADFNYYGGLMDSISFSRYALTADEVLELYESRGQCIGE